MEQKIILESNLSIKCAHFYNTFTVNVWDSWKEVPYINKFFNGSIGVVTQVDFNDVKKCCNW